MDNKPFLIRQAKTMADLFFYQEDQILRENLKKMEKMKETKENLSQVSGIKNDKILQKLVDLDIHPQTLAALSIIPLIQVAWADGKVDEKEKKAIMSLADNKIFNHNKIDLEILECWLNHKPDSKILNAWTDYVQGLCEELTQEEITTMKKEIIDHAYSVAKASGGFMGIGKISMEEDYTIATIKKAFETKCNNPG